MDAILPYNGFQVSGITGNEFVDSLAKARSNLPQPDLSANYYSNKRIIKASFLETITNLTSQNIWDSLLDNLIPYDMPRQVGIANFRTLIGYDYFRKHLHKFGLTDSPICPLCLTYSDISDDHLYYCPRFIDIVAVNVKKNFNHFVCISKLYWAAHYKLIVDIPMSGIGLKKV